MYEHDCGLFNELPVGDNEMVPFYRIATNCVHKNKHESDVKVTNFNVSIGSAQTTKMLTR